MGNDTLTFSASCSLATNSSVAPTDANSRGVNTVVGTYRIPRERYSGFISRSNIFTNCWFGAFHEISPRGLHIFNVM